MNTSAKLIAALVVVALIMAAIIGLLVGPGWAMSQPSVVAALAEQERAKAEALAAQADTERARASAEWINTEAQRAAMDKIILGIRWRALGGGIALTILMVGLALAAVTWANVRARTIYPDGRGRFPILLEKYNDGKKKGTHVLAIGRLLAPHVQLQSSGRVAMTYVGDQTLAAQLATQDQAGAVMTAIAGKDSAEHVSNRIRQASSSIPAPTFAEAAPGQALRFAYVKQPGMGNSAASRELGDLKEFIQTGHGPRGLARAAWIGQTFTGTSNRCSRSYYDSILEKLGKAGCVRKEGNA